MVVGCMHVQHDFYHHLRTATQDGAALPCPTANKSPDGLSSPMLSLSFSSAFPGNCRGATRVRISRATIDYTAMTRSTRGRHGQMPMDTGEQRIIKEPSDAGF